MKRIFVVGMPRSGTTLLQTLIGSSGKYFIKHESHIPLSITECFNKKLFVTRWVSQATLAIKFYKYFKKIYLPLNEKNTFIEFDRLMIEEVKKYGHDGYVEKTPSNLYVTEKIVKYFSNPIIIYISRSPKYNIKSYLKSSVYWDKKPSQLTLKSAIFRYNSDTFEALYYDYIFDNFHIVSYDRLLEFRTDRSELEKIEKIIQTSIVTDPDILAQYASKVVSVEEHWKSNNLRGNIIYRSSSEDYWKLQGFEEFKKLSYKLIEICQ